MATVGVVVSPVVTAVRVCPNVGVPLIVTVPPRVALAVVIVALAALTGEALRFAVSANLA